MLLSQDNGQPVPLRVPTFKVEQLAMLYEAGVIGVKGDGAGDGCEVGSKVILALLRVLGWEVDGGNVGRCVEGRYVGVDEGFREGWDVGVGAGCREGLTEGWLVGSSEGSTEGCMEG